MQHKSLIFVVISVLVVALVYSPSATFSVTNRSNDDDATCTPTGKETAEGLEEVECCWYDRVPPGTGNPDLGSPPGSSQEYCSTCGNGGTRGNINCSDPEPQFLVGRAPGREVLPEEGVLEQPPTPPPFDPTAPLQGGILEQPPTPPPSGPVAPLQGGILGQLEQGEGATPGFVPGFLERQQLQPPPADQGAAELPPPATTEETQPATVEEEPPVPVCQEGLEFNEDLGFCVPEDCPEGQVLDEESGICVLEEQPAVAEEPQTEESTEVNSEEPQSDDEEQTSDQEDNSEDNNSNN